MSAFSRGCILNARLLSRSAQCSQSFFIAQSVTPRTFSTSQFLNAVKKKVKKPPAPSPPPQAAPPTAVPWKAIAKQGAPSKAVPPKSTPSKAVHPEAVPSKPSPQISKPVVPITTPKPPTIDYVSNPYAKSLAELSKPTLLYEAPSHTLLRTVSYIGTFFFLSYGTYCLYIYSQPLTGTPFWVGLTFGTGAIILFTMGGWLSTCPAGIIKTLRAIPKRIVIEKKMLGPQATQKLPDLVLEVEVRKTLPLPFMPNRIFYIDPKDMRVPEPLCPNLTPAQAADLKTVEKMLEEQGRKEAEYAANHKIGNMISNFGNWNFRIFEAIKRGWTREGFMVIRFVGLKGGREVSSAFKLDVIGGGYAKDSGKAIDRLCDVKGLR
jgi:hypothetical protein